MKKLIYDHPIILLVVGILGISFSAIFVRLSSAPSVVTAAYRLLWTVLLMAPYVFSRKTVRQELAHIDRKLLLKSAISGILLAVHFWTWFESLQHTSVASSTIIVYTEVIWVALGYCLFMKGRLSGKSILAIAITLAGSVIMALSDSTMAGNELYGDILSLIAAIAVAAYTLLGRSVRKEASTTSYTFIVYVFCALTLVLIILIRQIPMFGYGWTSILSGLLLAVFSTLLGHSIFSWCLKYFSPAFVSASKLCEPVIAGIAASFLFAELPTWLQILGDVIVLAGVVYFSLLEVKKPDSAAS